MRTTWINAWLCSALLLSGGAALAAPAPGAPAAQTAHGDRDFLDVALGVNQLELQLGQLAARKATTAEVKAMGARMVDKHTELGGQLAALSKQAGGSGAPAMTSDQRAIYDEAEAQSGAAFDTMFKQIVDAGHVKELAMYKDEAPRASSAALRDLAQKRVAKLEATLAQATPKPAPDASRDW